MLFYKVGDDETEWWGEYKTSDDGGKTWSKPTRLPDGFLGPIKNKPIQLPDGSILSPSSIEYYAGGDPKAEVWQVHLELSKDMGKTWKKIGPLNDGKEFNAIQPSILIYPDGKMQILCRTEYARRIGQAWSDDRGATWSRMSLTELPNPDAGTDAVMLRDGRALLVYNHSTSDGRDREFLNVAVSEDGKKWYAAMVLEDQEGEYSYPAVIQTSDGLVHVTYPWKRERIKHVVLDPRRFNLQEIRHGEQMVAFAGFRVYDPLPYIGPLLVRIPRAVNADHGERRLPAPPLDGFALRRIKPSAYIAIKLTAQRMSYYSIINTS